MKTVTPGSRTIVLDSKGNINSMQTAKANLASHPEYFALAAIGLVAGFVVWDIYEKVKTGVRTPLAVVGDFFQGRYPTPHQSKSIPGTKAWFQKHFT